MLAGPGYLPPFEYVHLVGTMRLPKRSYVNDTCIVQLAMLPELSYARNMPAQLSVSMQEGGALIRAEWESNHCALEIKLIGIGVDVTPLGPELQKGPSLFYSWGCSFPHSGLQTLAIRTGLYRAYLFTVPVTSGFRRMAVVVHG